MSVSLGGVSIFVFLVLLLLLLLLQISRCGFPVYLCLDWCLRRFPGLGGPHLGVCRPKVPMLPCWARGGSAWARARPASACAQLASRGPALRQGALVRGQKLVGSALGSAKASGQAGSGMQGSQSNSTGMRPGPGLHRDIDRHQRAQLASGGAWPCGRLHLPVGAEVARSGIGFGRECKAARALQLAQTWPCGWPAAESELRPAPSYSSPLHKSCL